MEKQDVLTKLRTHYKINVVNVDSNPNFDEKDFPGGTHRKVEFQNKKSKKKGSFFYSMGSGVTDIDDDSVILGLIGSLMHDSIYTDLDEFDGLGYEGKKAVKVYQQICKSQKIMARLGLGYYFDNLTEQEKDFFD